MKVYRKVYRMQTVLVVMGSLMCMMAAHASAVRLYDSLFLLGFCCIVIGIGSWLFSLIRVYRRGREARMRRERELQKRTTPSPQRGATNTMRWAR
jgi:hypothetical protein